MPLTRLQCLHKFFNEPYFGHDGSFKVLLFMKGIGKSSDLSDPLQLEMVVMQMALEMTKGTHDRYRIWEIREKVTALRQRLKVYTNFIRLPGVKLDVGNMTVISFGPEYAPHIKKENLLERHFRLLGFPHMDLYYEVFEEMEVALLPEETRGTIQGTFVLDEMIVPMRTLQALIYLDQATPIQMIATSSMRTSLDTIYPKSKPSICFSLSGYF